MPLRRLSLAPLGGAFYFCPKWNTNFFAFHFWRKVGHKLFCVSFWAKNPDLQQRSRHLERRTLQVAVRFPP